MPCLKNHEKVFTVGNVSMVFNKSLYKYKDCIMKNDIQISKYKLKKFIEDSKKVQDTKPKELSLEILKLLKIEEGTF